MENRIKSVGTVGDKSVFADPRGGRRRVLRVATFLVAALLLCSSGYFIWGLLIVPQLRLPAAVRDFHARFRALPSAKLPPRDPKDDWRRIHASGSPASSKVGQKSAGVVLGYISPWDPASLLSLERHSSELTHVACDWFTLSEAEATLNEESTDKARLLCVRKGIGFLPILRNLVGDEWQPEAVETLATGTPQDRKVFLDRLLTRLPAGACGVLVEWSQLDPTIKDSVSVLLGDMSSRLHASGKELWFTVPTGNDFDSFDMEAVAKVSDRMVASLHDENSEPDDPGPVASNDWFQGWLKTMMAHGDPGQWVISLGLYGYDWSPGNHGVVELGFTDAMARAAGAGVDPSSVDSTQDSPHFNYQGGGGQGEAHEVWFLDAVTFANQRRLAAPFHPGGIALDRLGTEDPAVWHVLAQDPGKPLDARQIAELSRISLEDQIASTGTGDFITVGDDPKPGERTVTDDAAGDLTERFVKFPVPEGITRQGDPGPHKVALTFDDGPDPKWTPRILEILRQKKAPAAFFVLGTQAQHYPDLLERIVREGHEVGNHTYTHENLAEAGDQQIELELNATTRLIEAVTDRSTAYFRPPYNSDGTPVHPGELRALRVARDLGYLTVTQSIDPDDWEKPGADALLRRVKNQRSSGSVILLHDGGGDRSQTVAALPSIIDYLRERGDEIVPLASIINLAPETVMPSLREQNQPLSARYVYGAFALLRWAENAVWTLLVIVTLLALLRVFFHLACAVRHRRRERDALTAAPFAPPVSVLLAAYNEERVIASTIAHLLDSEYPSAIEVVVVDDGSTDGTAAIVQEISRRESRVRFLSQKNGGKASALHRAFSEASHETLVMIDADTMVAPDGILRLIEPLADHSVGGVSGHIRVGNNRRWLGRFQDLEYLSAFEIDRRAQDLLGCIIVAPGALSAFRRRALTEAGPITNDTLAEDTDLTLQLHRLGWKVIYVPRAFADTEAPESVKSLLSQRFRWAFGTLQCLWKHREIMFSQGSGWLGWFAIPSVWLFQIAIVAVTPVLDILVLWSLWFGRGTAIWPYFVASLLLDAGLAVAALSFANRSKATALLSVPMRLLYRPLLGYVVWKCIFKALGGSWVRWSKLERTAAAITQKESLRNPPSR